LVRGGKDKYEVLACRISHKEKAMRQNETNPDFATVQQHIERANAQRAAYVGGLIVEGGAALARALKRLGAVMERGYNAELDARAIEADAFLRRSVSR
jgi:hypothetical protein